MTPEAIIEDRRLQETLDKIRKEEGYSFTTIAFYGPNKLSSPIKQHYVSGDKDNRFKLTILRKGRRLAGAVMRTEKHTVIANIGLALGSEEKIDYPILSSESLTAVLVAPLWYRNQVYGVLLSGQRSDRPLPKIFGNDDIRRKLGIFNGGK